MEKMYKKLNKRGGINIPASVRREMGWNRRTQWNWKLLRITDWS